MVDVALVFVATSSSEGSDRANLDLGNGQDALIDIVAGRANRTVVVATVPGAILTPWRNDVESILVNFMPGQELGNAVASGERTPLVGGSGGGGRGGAAACCWLLFDCACRLTCS